jgi:drug/metabolite transporter (DMT)-like permease
MDLAAIGLLAVAAVIHSGWNLLAKRGRDTQVFLWLALWVGAAVFVLPFALLYEPISAAGWGFIALSGALEAAYFFLLGGAYQGGDLSLVYPLSRGTGILGVTLFAALFLGEVPSLIGAAGIALILFGIYVLHLRTLDRPGWVAPLRALGTRSSRLALLTGLTVAAYSVVDRAGLRLVEPGRYLYLILLIPALVLTPYMLAVRRAVLRAEWRANRAAIAAVGVMFFGAALLVMTVLRLNKVSYVSSVREMAVVVAALFGMLILREPFGEKKLAGAALIFAGIVCISLAR